MNIIEVKNNLIKLVYEEDLKLASFIKIKDVATSYIAQIISIEASRTGKNAIAKIIFNFQTSIKGYDGSIPSINSEIELLDDSFIPNLFKKNEPLTIGSVNNSNITISADLLKDKPVIFAEKSYQYTELLQNIIKQNELHNHKTVIIDIFGDFKGDKLVATRNFKIPLNKYSIDYIFDRGFDDVTPENKAFIQDIFSELNEYIKTIEYIPFSNFTNVVDEEYKQTNLLQLIILRNRLSLFEKNGIFAQKPEEFKILDNYLDNNSTIIIDISLLKDGLQTEYINYIYSTMEKHNSNFYTFVPLNDTNSTKETLNKILGTTNVFSSVICPYSYKHANELKQCSKNMLMFTPIKQQNDFGAYNTFLHKLSENEFILFGKTTKFIPIIINMACTIETSQVSLSPEAKERNEIPQKINIIKNEPEIKNNEQEIISENKENIETTVIQDSENINIPENIIVEPIKDKNLEDMASLVQKELSEIDINITDDDISNIVKPVAKSDLEELSIETEEQTNNEKIEEVIEIVEDTENEPEELTDAELDLIQELEESTIEDTQTEYTENILNESNEDIQNPEIIIKQESDYQDNNSEEQNDKQPKKEQSITDQILQEEAERKAIEEANKPDPIEEQIEKPKEEKLETRAGVTPIVPVYSAEIPDEDIVESDSNLQQGDTVNHSEFGQGVIEKIINYGDRILYSINFDGVGRKLLDPNISELKKINI